MNWMLVPIDRSKGIVEHHALRVEERTVARVECSASEGWWLTVINPRNVVQRELIHDCSLTDAKMAARKLLLDNGWTAEQLRGV